MKLSKPETGKFGRAVAKANITLDTPTWKKKPTPIYLKHLASGMREHTWLPGKEDSVENRKAYMNYLNNEKNIRLPKGGKLFEGSADPQLLGVDIEVIGIKTSGNIDVVLAESRHQDITTTRQNMWAGIELKKDDNTSKAEIQRQVILQHLAASYLNEDAGILTLMTDLCERWHFYWFSKEKRRLMRYEATKAEAHFLIYHMMDESSSDILTPEDFLNRASWNQVVKPTSLGSVPGEDSQEEMDEQDEMDFDDEGSGGRSESALAQSGRTQGASTSGAQNSLGFLMRSPAGKRSRGKNHGMQDTSLDFMDEQERKEAVFQAVLKSSLPGMMHFPELTEEHSPPKGPPKDILLT